MKLMKNGSYFIREAVDIFRLNLMSNLSALLSTGLVFFLLALVIGGWVAGSHLVEALQGEALVGIYPSKDLAGEKALDGLLDAVSRTGGVGSAVLVSKEEAYTRMEAILGTDADVLAQVVDNPFEAFIEAQVDLDRAPAIVAGLEQLEGVAYVRNNRDVLEKLGQLAKALKLLGIFVLAAVGIATLVILSHAIRQSIFHYREQIQTLELLGAPTAFIAIPFFLEGIVLTLLGGAMAAGLFYWAALQVYARTAGPLPFVPLPPVEAVAGLAGRWTMGAALVLGFVGSAFGFASSRK